jgi:photosystem II stability/assembly factor-like uncharacterized protein
VLKTADGGQTWRKVSTGTGKSINSLVMANVTTGYLAGEQGLIMKTMDGGEKWATLNFPAGFNIRSLSLRDQNNVLMCGIDPAIYRTTNGGNSWEGVQTGTSAAINSVSVFNNTAYACGTSATVVKSTDFGVSWSKIVIPQLLEANLNRVQCVDENTCFVVGNQYILTSEVIFFARTADGGKNWMVKTFSYYPDKVVFSMFFTDALTGYLGGSDFLWKTTDGGNNWIEQKPRMADLGPNAICFADSQVGYAVGYSGQIMKTTNGGGLPAPEIQDDTSDMIYLKFPNPSNGPITIEYGISGNGQVNLLLYDLFGNKIVTLVDETQMPGNYFFPYDSGNLPAGIYVLRLAAGKLVQTRKLMVIH